MHTARSLTVSRSIVIVCPLGAVCAYYIKGPCLLVRHRKRLFTWLNKVTHCFSFGGSRQSLKVLEVKCIPGDPAITVLYIRLLIYAGLSLFIKVGLMYIWLYA